MRRSIILYEHPNSCFFNTLLGFAARLLPAQRLQRLEDPLRRHREVQKPHANGVPNRAGDRRRWGAGRRLTDPAGAERSLALSGLDHDGPDIGHIRRRRDEIAGEERGEVVAGVEHDVLHQGLPRSHDGTALDLTFDALWVDGPPDIVAGHVLEELDGPRL